MTKYPTEWAYGLPRGSIADKNTSYMLSITDDKKKTRTINYKILNFTSKEDCLTHVESDYVTSVIVTTNIMLKIKLRQNTILMELMESN